jgi:hypothetical protein
VFSREVNNLCSYITVFALLPLLTACIFINSVYDSNLIPASVHSPPSPYSQQIISTCSHVVSMWSPHGSYLLSLAYMVCVVRYYLVLFCLVSHVTNWPVPVSLLVTVSLCFFVPTWSALTQHGHCVIPVWSLCGLIGLPGPQVVTPGPSVFPIWSLWFFHAHFPTFIVSVWSLYWFSFSLRCLYLICSCSTGRHHVYSKRSNSYYLGAMSALRIFILYNHLLHTIWLKEHQFK